MLNVITAIFGQCVLFSVATPIMLLSKLFNSEDRVKDHLSSMYHELIQESIDKSNLSKDNYQAIYEEILALLFFTTLCFIAFRSFRNNLLHDLGKTIKRKIKWKMSMSGEQVNLVTPDWFDY